MKTESFVWFLFLPLILLLLVMFYFEVSLYSLLPPDQGGMSFLMELKNVWYRSVFFYALVSAFIAFSVAFVLRKRH